jgi:hypothetical protein
MRAAILLLALVGCSKASSTGSSSSQAEPPPPLKQEAHKPIKKAVELDKIKLLQDYGANPVSARRKWEGSYIRTTMNTHEIGETERGGFRLQEIGSNFEVDAETSDSKVLKLRGVENITIEGTIKGVSETGYGMRLKLTGSRIVEIHPRKE